MRPFSLRHIAKSVRRSRESDRSAIDDPATLRCSVAYNKFGAYCVPESSRHRPAARRILSGEVWEEETVLYVAEYAGKGDIVHAGTYFGDFLPALSKACGSAAMIWAFEPNDENYRSAQITILLNNISNVNIYGAALGKINGNAFIETVDAEGQALGGASHILTTESTRSEAVRVVALDDIIPEDRTVSVIQLDVEGYEVEALSGALNILRRCRPALVLESCPEEEWFEQQLHNIGYREAGRVNGNTVLEPDGGARGLERRTLG